MDSQVIFSLPFEEFKLLLKQTIKDVQEETKQGETSTTSELPELPTCKQTANYLGISKVSLWKWTKDGKLQSYHISGRIRYKRDEVLKAVQEVKNLKCKKK